MFMNPVNGIFGVSLPAGLSTNRFFGQYPSGSSITFIVSWMWLPFATLILANGLQSLDQEQLEAAEMDGANWLNRFLFIMLPHLGPRDYGRDSDPNDLSSVDFAEILVTTNGGPGTATTNLTY